MWRNEGWSGYRRTVGNAHNTEEEIYEAGAEAMLEGLANLVGDDGWIQFEKEDGKVVAVYIDD